MFRSHFRLCLHILPGEANTCASACVGVRRVGRLSRLACLPASPLSGTAQRVRCGEIVRSEGVGEQMDHVDCSVAVVDTYKKRALQADGGSLATALFFVLKLDFGVLCRDCWRKCWMDHWLAGEYAGSLD
ncbi:hypothetical protein HDK90DRAFT_474945 [Phyllosticta capitalensis]|uniref:Uncharacterized protein n=1 Tax=Phyllosticta capitalensis TaxID=121624 RepID=A0ABR1YXL1_9PEZI